MANKALSPKFWHYAKLKLCEITMFVGFFTISLTTAIDNGLGITPPRGWRSWNQFGTQIRQDLIEAQYRALVSRSRKVEGIPTSLLDLGYSAVGIDDGWQMCNSGPNGVGFHDTNGYPIVDTTKFPNMTGMTTLAKSLGVTAGWYANNCACKETRPQCAYSNTSNTSCFAGDVAATLDYGFESIKIDSCGIERNMSNFASLFNLSGKAVVLENCHNGYPYHPIRTSHDKIECPMNLFRTSGDIRPQWGSILSNLMTTSEFNDGLTGPGCWGYPDMLEVGVSQMPEKGSLNFLTPSETRTHFAAWCIVSSPLTLSHDLTNDSTMDAVWPIITNREALAVNDAWFGDAGVLIKKSDEMLPFTNCAWGFNRTCRHAATMVWKKQLPDGKMAVLLMNNKNVTADVNITWSVDLPEDLNFRCAPGGCPVRDIYGHKDLGIFEKKFVAKNVAPHDSVFIVVQQCMKEPTYPFKCINQTKMTRLTSSLLSDVARAVYLTDYPLAKCLDGSPGYYYIRPGIGTNATKWVFHMQGGGWCDSDASCHGRVNSYLGTSNKNVTNYTDIAEFSDVKCDNQGCGALMLSDPAINELSYDWNAVFMRYCDGMSFSSNASKPGVDPLTNLPLHYRGAEILKGTMLSLTQHYGLGNATQVILGGASAGGLATWLHADTQSDYIYAANAAAGKPNATVIALPDSGFWPDDTRQRFSDIFRGWFSTQGNVTDGLPKHCKWLGTNTTRCLFPQYFADEIETRMFPIQSLYDPLQIWNDFPKHEGGDPNLHGDWILDTINRTVLQGKRALGSAPNGAFLHSCSRHCGAELVSIDGFTVPIALETLLRVDNVSDAGLDHSLFLDHETYPCKACCNDKPYPPISKKRI